VIELFLVNKAYLPCFGLRTNQLRTLEICQSTVPNYVLGTRPDSFHEYQYTKDPADDGDITADYEA
jgi:hypothetical protein